MKTTVDLPESLLKQAKHKALQNNTSLRALMISGLKKELASSKRTVSDPIEQIRMPGSSFGVASKRIVTSANCARTENNARFLGHESVRVLMGRIGSHATSGIAEKLATPTRKPS